jgi:hypothetical protein
MPARAPRERIFILLSNVNFAALARALVQTLIESVPVAAGP